jgi:membrane-bound lytic murein transglycosylase D
MTQTLFRSLLAPGLFLAGSAHVMAAADLAYRADRPASAIAMPVAGAQLPALLEEFEPRSELLPAAVRIESAAATPKSHLYVWDRVRAGYALPELDDPLVTHWQAWYLGRPQLLKAMFERSRRYIYHVVEELDKRGMPTELALLPMVESGYNPMALSPAQASGLWQFIPSTGKEYKLEQSPLYDARRDIIASTAAALDYLQFLQQQFGDWKLALASYNWGEAAVGRAIERNKAKGLPADYRALALPEETRNYVPKLQALKNIVADPGAFGIDLEQVPNRPYFAAVASARDLDVNVAARLADVPLEEFLALNPAHQHPTISRNSRMQIVLPVDKLDSFVRKLEAYERPSAGGKAGKRGRSSKLNPATYLVKAGDTLAAIAQKLRVPEIQLKALNPLADAGIRAGQKLIVHPD